MNAVAGIAGGGLAGLLMAWRLLRSGWRVELFDRAPRADAVSASRIAGGMVAPDNEAAEGEAAIADYGEAALALWPGWLDELRQDSDIAVEWRGRGSLVVAHGADRGELQRLCRRLQRCFGEPGDRWQRLDGAQLQQLEPQLGERFQTAVLISREACMDNRRLLDALNEAICNLGGVVHRGVAVDSVEPRALKVGDRELGFELAVDCRGVGAADALPTLRAVRGEIIRLRAPEVSFSRPVRLMHPRYKLYVVPRPDSIFDIGASEIESGHEGGVSLRSALELLSAAFSLHPGFAEAEILELNAANRPAFPDNLPQVLCRPGLIRLNGFFRNGYVAAPVLVQWALQSLKTEARPVRLAEVS